MIQPLAAPGKANSEEMQVSSVEPVGESELVSRPFPGRMPEIALFAIVLKVILLFGLFPHLQASFSEDYNVGTFRDDYEMIAWNLVQGNGYRVFPDTSLTMLRTPGFVLLLALIFAVFGKSLVAVRVVNLAFSIVTAVLTRVLALKAGLSRTAATIAALIFFLHPGVTIADSQGAVESMVTLCLVASVLLGLSAMERGNWAIFVVAGLANGLALLVKSSVALVLPALFLYGMWRSRSGSARRKILIGMVTCGLVSALVLAPWVVRNYQLSGKFIPTMTVGGLVAFQGAYVIQHLNSNLESSQLLEQAADQQVVIANAMGLKQKGRFFPQFPTVGDEVAFYGELGRRAEDDYKQDPELLVQAVVHNTWAFWIWGKTRRATVFNAILTLPLLTLAGIGLRAGIKNGLEVLPFPLVPHLIFIAVARYHIPLVPFVAVLAAIPLASWFDQFARTREGCFIVRRPSEVFHGSA